MKNTITHDPDLKDRSSQLILRFGQEAKRNPRAYIKYDQAPIVPGHRIRCFLNGVRIPSRLIRRINQAAGNITGFQLGEHQMIHITLPGRRFINGGNNHAFHIPFFPKATVPYVYIYDFEVEVRGRK